MTLLLGRGVRLLARLGARLPQRPGARLRCYVCYLGSLLLGRV